MEPQRQPGLQRDFMWYNFPEVVGPSMYLEWKNKLAWLRTKAIDIPPIMDYNWIQVADLLEQVEPYLTKLFVQDGVRLTCMGWRRLFRIKESVYMEICVEFFSSINFRKLDDVNDPKNFTFCLDS